MEDGLGAPKDPKKVCSPRWKGRRPSGDAKFAAARRRKKGKKIKGSRYGRRFGAAA